MVCGTRGLPGHAPPLHRPCHEGGAPNILRKLAASSFPWALAPASKWPAEHSPALVLPRTRTSLRCSNSTMALPHRSILQGGETLPALGRPCPRVAPRAAPSRPFKLYIGRVSSSQSCPIKNTPRREHFTLFPPARPKGEEGGPTASQRAPTELHNTYAKAMCSHGA